MRSLRRALNDDAAGRRVIDPSAGPLSADQSAEDGQASGAIQGKQSQPGVNALAQALPDEAVPEPWTTRGWSFQASGLRLAGCNAELHEHDRGFVADRAVEPVPILVSAPCRRLFLRVGKGQEAAGVQTFRPQPTVERLDEGVVGRTSRIALVS
jgi:hypothetical protein